MKLRSIIASGMLAAGMALVQAAPPPANTQATTQNDKENWQARALQRMTEKLSLTPDQQTQVKGILQDAQNQRSTLMSKVRQERRELKTAVESNSVAKIDQITQKDANLNAEIEAMHLKAMAKVYQLLTPDQKTKFDHNFMTGRVARHHANNS